MNEFELIKNYFKKLTKNNPNAKKLNDDIFFDKKNNLAISVDTYNEGVHFQNFKKPNLVIKKVIRSSISDLICKGIKPKYYFISGSGNNKNFTKRNLKLISNSLKEEQKKYNIKLSGGDTTKSTKVSFTITAVGFSNKVIFRNTAKLNDDIYVTGNIGDSYVGLKIIQNKIIVNSRLRKYFVQKYYCPDLPYKFHAYIKKIANTSMDISDGLISDMIKLINDQKLSFTVNINKIPLSKSLRLLLSEKNHKRSKYLFNGDDYQILFTASKKNRSKIKRISKKLNQKITIIGKINNRLAKHLLLLDNKSVNLVNYQGYSHKFK